MFLLGLFLALFCPVAVVFSGVATIIDDINQNTFPVGPDGRPVIWSQRDIPICYLHASSLTGLDRTEVTNAIHEAELMWERVSPVKFVEEPDACSEPNNHRGAITVSWYDGRNTSAIGAGGEQIRITTQSTRSAIQLGGEQLRSNLKKLKKAEVDLGFVKLNAYALGQLEARVTRMRFQSMLTATISHELGHAIGINHVSDRASIMFPVTVGLTGLGDGDIAAVQNLYGVNGDRDPRPRPRDIKPERHPADLGASLVDKQSRPVTVIGADKEDDVLLLIDYPSSVHSVGFIVQDFRGAGRLRDGVDLPVLGNAAPTDCDGASRCRTIMEVGPEALLAALAEATTVTVQVVLDGAIAKTMVAQVALAPGAGDPKGVRSVRKVAVQLVEPRWHNCDLVLDFSGPPINALTQWSGATLPIARSKVPMALVSNCRKCQLKADVR